MSEKKPGSSDRYRPGAGSDNAPVAELAPPAKADFIPSGSENFSFFPEQVVDNLMHVVIGLGAEHWTMRRRMFMLEKVLEQSGALTKDAVEQFQPTAADLAAWEEERDIFIKRAFGALSRTGKSKPGL